MDEKYFKIWEAGREAAYSSNRQIFERIFNLKTLTVTQGLFLFCDCWVSGYPRLSAGSDLLTRAVANSNITLLSVEEKSFTHGPNGLDLRLEIEKVNASLRHSDARDNLSKKEREMTNDLREKKEILERWHNEIVETNRGILREFQKYKNDWLPDIFEMWESDTGNSEERYPILYFIEWARENSIEVPWLVWAQQKGLLPMREQMRQQTNVEMISFEEFKNVFTTKEKSFRSGRNRFKLAAPAYEVYLIAIDRVPGDSNKKIIGALTEQKMTDSDGEVVTRSKIEDIWKILTKINMIAKRTTPI